MDPDESGDSKKSSTNPDLERAVEALERIFHDNFGPFTAPENEMFELEANGFRYQFKRLQKGDGTFVFHASVDFLDGRKLDDILVKVTLPNEIKDESEDESESEFESESEYEGESEFESRSEDDMDDLLRSLNDPSIVGHSFMPIDSTERKNSESLFFESEDEAKSEGVSETGSRKSSHRSILRSSSTEIEILRELEEEKEYRNSPHLLGSYTPTDPSKPTVMITEYFRAGTLKNSPELTLELIQKVAIAVSDLHDKGYIHSDIKPENIMFRDDSHDEIVFIDFETPIANTPGLLPESGTFTYVAPEVTFPDKYLIINKDEDEILYSYKFPSELGLYAPSKADLYSLSMWIIYYLFFPGGPEYERDKSNAIDRLPMNADESQNPLFILLVDSTKKDPAERIDMPEFVDRLMDISEDEFEKAKEHAQIN